MNQDPYSDFKASSNKPRDWLASDEISPKNKTEGGDSQIKKQNELSPF